jgi:hypothetical protein
MRLVIAAIVLAPSIALAQEAEAPPDEYDEPYSEIGEAPGASVGERELGGGIGAAMGGGLTPGGIRVTGDYLYQLSDLDWFDGIVQFTFGTGGAECFRDRQDMVVCDHGPADGVATDLAAGVRRFFPGRDAFRPWVRPAVGVRLSHFSDDDVTGVGVFLSAGGGVRARVSDTIAVGGQAAVEVGGSYFNGDVGAALQLGLAVAVTCEFALP